MTERAIRSVAVLGGGIVGLSAALAFAGALPGVRIEIIETPPDPAALADRMPGTLPPVHRFHAAIGLDELDLVRRGIATHRLGTRFENWSADGDPWYHTFGACGLPVGSVAFHQLWVRARREGRALPYGCYGAAARLAEAGKFVHPEPDPRSPLATYLYGLRLDPGRYRERLLAQAGGIARSAGQLGEAERRADGGVAALRLADGRRIEADLFLDCSGPSAPLLGEAAFEDWDEWLPCDRLLLGEEPSAGLSPTDTLTASDRGWRFASPLPGRVLAGFAWSSRYADEAQVRASQGAAEMVSIRPGRRLEPWVRNVLAIGDGAVALDPLESTNLHLAQSAILRALELLPGRDCHPLELREYNRRTEQEAIRVRDFLALHYLRSGRTKGELWRRMAKRRPPESLGRTLEQFEARGRLPYFEEETFETPSWLAVLLGHGVMPGAFNPAAGAVDFEESVAAMAALAERLAAIPRRLPSYRDYLERMARAPATSARAGA